MFKSYKLNKKINELHEIVHNKISNLNLASTLISLDVYKEKSAELFILADKYFEYDDNLIEYINEANPTLEMSYKKNHYQNKLNKLKEEYREQAHWITVLEKDILQTKDLIVDDMEDEYLKLQDLIKEYIEYKALLNLDSNDYSDFLVDDVYSFISGLTPKEAWDIESSMSLSSSVPYIQSDDYEISFHYPKAYVEKYKFKYQDYSFSKSRKDYYVSRIFGYIPEGVEEFYKGVRSIKSSYELAEIDNFREITKEIEAS